MKWEREAREAERLLRRLGANGSYMGFWFTVYGIAMVMREPELLTYMCKGLYEAVASHFNVSLQSAERNIRTIKKRIWKYGDEELLREIFGRSTKKSPKNAVFLDGLAAYLNERCMGEPPGEERRL